MAAFGKPLETGPPGARGRSQEGPGLSLQAEIINVRDPWHCQMSESGYSQCASV